MFHPHIATSHTFSIYLFFIYFLFTFFTCFFVKLPSDCFYGELSDYLLWAVMHMRSKLVDFIYIYFIQLLHFLHGRTKYFACNKAVNFIFVLILVNVKLKIHILTGFVCHAFFGKIIISIYECLSKTLAYRSFENTSYVYLSIANH